MSEKLASLFEGLDFESNIMLLGRIAVLYSCCSTAAPERYWGSTLGRNALRVGNNQYSVNDGRHNGQLGVLVRVNRNHFGGGPKSADTFFIPWSALDSVLWSVKGVRLP